MRSNLVYAIAALVVLLGSTACDRCRHVPALRSSASTSWSITSAGNVATCAQVGAASVSLLLHNRASGDDTASSFACADMQGTSTPVAVGTYDATLILRAADGATVAAGPTQAAFTIAADLVTELQAVVFRVSDQGKLIVSLATLGTSANCTSP